MTIAKEFVKKKERRIVAKFRVHGSREKWPQCITLAHDSFFELKMTTKIRRKEKNRPYFIFWPKSMFTGSGGYAVMSGQNMRLGEILSLTISNICTNDMKDSS